MLFPRLFGSGGNQNTNQQQQPNTLPDGSSTTVAPEVPPFSAPPPRSFGSITLAPPQSQSQSQRTHHELPRLQIPPLSLIQPQQPQQPQLHWKAAAVEQPPAPPVSRMRMVANFFSSEARQQQHQLQLQQQQQLQAPAPSNGGMLPSFSEILARTKQLYIHPSPSTEVGVGVDLHVDHDHDMEDAGRMSEESDLSMMLPSSHAPLEPNYAAARYALQPPAPMTIDTSYSMEEYGDNNGMETPSSPCPSGSMSPMSQSGKLSKRRERWTEDEHARFMEGLNRYGRKWKKIQGFVQTKTAVQVRTHAYGYFAKLLRNMPEDDAAWELAEEMSSLPGAVLKGPSSGKRRSEPKTDEAGMDILRRFVFSKKKTEAASLPKSELGGSSSASISVEPSVTSSLVAPAPQHMWGVNHEGWNLMESQASSVMLDLKRQRIN